MEIFHGTLMVFFGGFLWANDVALQHDDVGTILQPGEGWEILPPTYRGRELFQPFDVGRSIASEGIRLTPELALEDASMVA